DAEHTWSPDWQDRLLDRVRSLGYSKISVLLAAMPSRPYVEIARRLGSNVPPIQVLAVQFREAKAEGTVREAAKDSLAPRITDELPGGWGIGENAEYRMASALADWASSVTVSGECDDLEPTINGIMRSFRAPTGWLPNGPDDPIIEAAFSGLWSEG